MAYMSAVESGYEHIFKRDAGKVMPDYAANVAICLSLLAYRALERYVSYENVDS